METKLLLGSSFALVAGIVYAYVGYRLGQRKVEARAKSALLAFSAWWIGLAGVTASAALAGIVVALGWGGSHLFIATTYANLVILALALAGLLYYLLFLFTGKTFWGLLLLPSYYAYAIFLVYFIRTHRPQSIDVEGWVVTTQYETPLRDDPLFTVVLVLLLLPQILAALAYLLLAFKVKERTLRYRIVMVSVSLVVWFGSAWAAAATGLSDADAWQLTSRAIGLMAALGVLAAYYPPAMLRRRFGLATIEGSRDDGGGR